MPSDNRNIFSDYNIDDSFNSLYGSMLGITNLVKESERKKKQKLRELAASMTEYEIDLYNEGVRLKNIEIDKHNAKLEEKRRIIKCINNHKCPNEDNGVLIRGKKEKDNDYKRGYVCNVCKSKWYKE